GARQPSAPRPKVTTTAHRTCPNIANARDDSIVVPPVSPTSSVPVSRLVDAAGELVPALGDAVVPGLPLLAGDLFHRDAAGDGAHELAQVAADALRLVDPRDAIAGESAHGERFGRLGLAGGVRVGRALALSRAGEDALVRAVVARGHAQMAADAALGVDACDE